MYYLIGGNSFTWLMISISLLITAIAVDTRVLDNKGFKFVSGLRMDIYLSHMFVFRILEKLKLNQIIGDGWAQYLLTCFLVITGAIIFAYVITKALAFFKAKVLKSSNAG
ncbi:MAG: hypothetical protein K6C08_12005 [Oscillospiraceae bacterium]|nr:hypothetical protein [Oscillospiraceae bacterium]